jgi:hypothetical protein
MFARLLQCSARSGASQLIPVGHFLRAAALVVGHFGLLALLGHFCVHPF